MLTRKHFNQFYIAGGGSRRLQGGCKGMLCSHSSFTLNGKRQRFSPYMPISVAFDGKTGSKINEKQRKKEKRLYSVAFSTKKATETVEFSKIRCFQGQKWCKKQ